MNIIRYIISAFIGFGIGGFFSNAHLGKYHNEFVFGTIAVVSLIVYIVVLIKQNYDLTFKK